MIRDSKIRAGIIGLGRGQGFIKPLMELPGSELAALCDINPGAVEGMRRRFGVPDSTQGFTDIDEMLEKADLDVIFVATPIRFHLQHCLKALEKGVITIGEVPAVYSIEEAQTLVSACNSSKASYMMAENANYFKFNIIVREMANAGLFGDLYYAEAEYLHELKDLIMRKTPWRYECLFGRNGITYGTHSVGPVMSWLPDDRIKSISCIGSGHNYLNTAGEKMPADDTCVMMCKTEKERLIKIRMDFMSPRPAINRYQLQGTKAAFESKYHDGDFNKIAFSEAGNSEGWEDLYKYEAEYFPARFKQAEETANKYGHDGADYFMVLDIIDSIGSGRELPIDLHRSLDLTLPGIISRQSADNGGVWLDVPDSRRWRI